MYCMYNQTQLLFWAFFWDVVFFLFLHNLTFTLLSKKKKKRILKTISTCEYKRCWESFALSEFPLVSMIKTCDWVPHGLMCFLMFLFQHWAALRSQKMIWCVSNVRVRVWKNAGKWNISSHVQMIRHMTDAKP